MLRIYWHKIIDMLPPLLIIMLSGCTMQMDTSGGSPLGTAQSLDGFDKGADRSPTAKTLHAMARILAIQRKDIQAEFLLQRLILDYPRFVAGYSYLAELHMRQRRGDEAQQVLERGLDVSPDDPVLLNNLGMCRMVKGDWEKALALFTQASAKAPDNARYRANMAVALGLLGRYDESIALYPQIVSLSDAHYNLAVICEARKDSERATEEFKLAKRWDQLLSSHSRPGDPS